MINEAFIVHNLDQGLLVAKIATEENKPAIILSAPGAGASLGPVVFSQMISLITEAYPKAKICGLLDCGSEPGIAMTAIRRGTTDIYFTTTKEEILKVEVYIIEKIMVVRFVVKIG